MYDLLHQDKTVDFLKAISQSERDVEKTYSLNAERVDQLLDLMSCLFVCSHLGMYGFSVLPNGMDAVFTVRLAYLSEPQEYNISDLLENVVSYKLIPLEEHFLLEITIKDFFVESE